MKTYFTFMKEMKESTRKAFRATGPSRPYTLYHASYTDAINAALAHHKGLNVSDEDRDTHIAMGPRKPVEGETVKHRIPATDKNGDDHMIDIQVFNKGGNKPFELNTYSSKVSKKKVAEETVDVSEGLGDVHSSSPFGDPKGLKAYANSLGPKHRDRHDLLTAASHMAFGNRAHLTKHLKTLDTDVRDKVKEYMKEEVEIDEALGTIKNMKAASKFGSSNVSDMIRGEKARKAGMAKVSTTKDIGYKVVDVGPGQKETVRKMHNFKEQSDQIDEISKTTLASYSQKTSKLIKGNQPADPDMLRKRTNRERGFNLAYRKYYGYKTKVPAIDEMHSTAITYHDHIEAKEMTPAEIKARHKSYLDTETHHRKRSKDPNLTSNQRMASGAVASAAKMAAAEWERKYMKEATEIDEANSHRKVDDLKSKGKHHEAGVLAAKSSHDRQYGAHFGMRSGKEEAQRQFFKGYDSVKKTNE